MDDPLLAETLLDSQTVYAGRLIRVTVDTVRLPDGQQARREIVRHPGAVAILAVDGEQILFVRQYRHAVGESLLELPAGKIEAGETPLATAQRELAEETGFQAATWTPLGRTIVSPGFTDEVIHLFRAQDLEPTTAGVPDADEFLVVERLSRAEALAAVAAGRIVDAKTQAALFLAGLSPANR